VKSQINVNAMSTEGIAAIYVALNFISALLTTALCIYMVRKQGWKNAFTFVALLSATAIFSLMNGLSMLSSTTEIAAFWERWRWLSLALIPPLLLIFVLDFKIEGRNKIYLIKSTAEARNYLIMAEINRINYILDKLYS